MPGPRKDKERAWKNLAELLRMQEQVTATLVMADCQIPSKTAREDVQRALTNLQHSGRLNAGQILLIRKLVQAVIRVERNVT